MPKGSNINITEIMQDYRKGTLNFRLLASAWKSKHGSCVQSFQTITSTISASILIHQLYFNGVIGVLGKDYAAWGSFLVLGDSGKLGRWEPHHLFLLGFKSFPWMLFLLPLAPLCGLQTDFTRGRRTGCHSARILKPSGGVCFLFFSFLELVS